MAPLLDIHVFYFALFRKYLMFFETFDIYSALENLNLSKSKKDKRDVAAIRNFYYYYYLPEHGF